MVITVRVANSNVHRMLIDDGNVVDIIYLDAYKKMRLTESDLSPMTSPLYTVIGDHMIPKETIKLAMMVGEHPRVSTIITEFLIVDCPFSFNGIIGRPLLRALGAPTLIYHLTMKFPTAEGIGHVKGSQFDSREGYNKSLKLAKRKRKLP